MVAGVKEYLFSEVRSNLTKLTDVMYAARKIMAKWIKYCDMLFFFIVLILPHSAFDDQFSTQKKHKNQCDKINKIARVDHTTA